MATYARPISDVSSGLWQTDTGASTNLFAAIDEAQHSETDYIVASLAAGSAVVGGGIPDTTSAPQLYTSNGTGGTPHSCHYIEIFGADDFKEALVFYRDDFSQVTPTNVVFWFHGATATETQLINNVFGTSSGGNVLLDSWLDLGWIVIAPRLGSTGSAPAAKGQWGNNAMCDGMAALYSWTNSVFTVPAKGFFFAGFSAGGTNSLNALITAKRVGQAVAAIAVIDPAINLRWFADIQGGNIDTAYGLVGQYANQKTGSYAIKSISPDGLTIDRDSLRSVLGKQWVRSDTSSGGYTGGRFNVIAGPGEGQIRTIVSNTEYTVTIDAPLVGVTETASGTTDPSYFSIATSAWVAIVDEDANGGHDGGIVDLATLIPRIPYYITASPSDTTVWQEQNADVFRRRLEALGWSSLRSPNTGPELWWEQQTKNHGDPTHFKPTETNAFFARALS